VQFKQLNSKELNAVNFIEQLTYAHMYNRQQSDKAPTTTKPPKQQHCMEQYRTNIIALALTKLKQKKREKLNDQH